MKKVISVLLAAILLTNIALPSYAAEEALIFAAEEASTEASSEDCSADAAAEDTSEEDVSTEASSEEYSSEASSEEASSLPEDYYTEYPTGYLNIGSDATYESVSEGADESGLYVAYYLPEYYVTPNLPELKSQWPYGTCWAFAATALAEINLAKKNALRADFSELQLAYFGYRWVTDPLGGLGDPECPGPIAGNLNFGGMIEQALLEYTRGQGPADEAVAPYASEAETANSVGLKDDIAYAGSARITDYFVEPIDVNNLAPIKQLITEYGAAAVSFHAESSMNSGVNAGIYSVQNNCYYNSTYDEPNHAVVIVGWDDSFPKENFVETPEGDGAFLVRNSWTTGSIGDNLKYSGYFWMSYYEATLQRYAYAADFASDMPYDNNYQYDLSLISGYMNCKSAANIFTAAANDGGYGELVKAVGFDTNSSNLELRIDIYKDIDSIADIAVTEPASTKVITTTYAGFHTAALDEAVYVKKGDTFAVVITDISPGGSGFGLLTEHASYLNVFGRRYYYGISSSNCSFDIPEDSSSDKWLASRDLGIKAFTVNNNSPIEDSLIDMTVGCSLGDAPICCGDEAELFVNTIPEDYKLKEEVQWSVIPEDMALPVTEGKTAFLKPGYVTICAAAEGVSAARQFTVFPSEAWFDYETDDSGGISFTWDKIDAATRYEFVSEDGSKTAVVEEDGSSVHTLSLDWFKAEGSSGKRTIRIYTYYIEEYNVLDLEAEISFEDPEADITELRILDTQKPPHLLGSSKAVPTTYLYGKEYADDTANITLSKLKDTYGEEDGVLKLGVGKSCTLKADFLPKLKIKSGGKTVYTDKTANKEVIWSSANTSIATISSGGKVTGKRAGTTVIRLTNPKSGLTASCPVTVYDPVTTLTLDKKTLKLGLGQKAEIKAVRILPATASDTLIFTSSKPSVVRVQDSMSGVIEAVGEGTAIITVTAEGGKTAACTVTVGKAVSSMKLSGKAGKESVAVGRTLQMVTTFNNGEKANQPANKDVVYGIVDSGEVSAGNECAIINSKGVLKGLREGMVTVRASSVTDRINGEPVYADTDIYVYSALKSASMSKKTLTMAPGSSYTLSVKLKSAAGDSYVTRGEMIWSCKPEGVLEICDNGDGTCKVTAPTDELPKTVTVTAAFIAYGAAKPTAVTCSVSVKNRDISAIRVTPSSVTMSRGESIVLAADLTPLSPADGRIRWEVKSGFEDEICFVDKNGNETDGSIITEGPDENCVTVKAKSTGKLGKSKAVVKVTALGPCKNGRHLSKEIVINIGNEAMGMAIRKGSSPLKTSEDNPVALCAGKSLSLNAVVYAGEADPYGAKAGNQKVIWKSSNPEIAAVSSLGKVTGISCGAARITAVSLSKESVEASVYIGVYSDSGKLTLEKTKLTMSITVDKNGSALPLSGQYDVLGTIVANEDMFNNDTSLGVYSDKVSWSISGSGAVKLAAVDAAALRNAKGIGRKQEYLASLDAAFVDPLIFEGTGRGQLLAIKAIEPGTVKLTARAGSKKATCTLTIKIYKTE